MPRLPENPVAAGADEDAGTDDQPDTRALFITPDLIRQPCGNYIPLNPDIEKTHPPRYGGRRLYSDPFNVSDEEAPPVPVESLSPSHVFGSLSDLHNSIVERQKQQAGQVIIVNNKPESDNSPDDRTPSTQPSSPLDDDEDDCRSVVLATGMEAHRAGRLTAAEMVDDLPDPCKLEWRRERRAAGDSVISARPDVIDLPLTADLHEPGEISPGGDNGHGGDRRSPSDSSGHGSLNSSPFATYSKVNKPRRTTGVPDTVREDRPATGGGQDGSTMGDAGPGELENLAIGQLDYDQLMQYFETLKESAA